MKQRGILTYWLVDISKIRKKVEAIERWLHTSKINPLIKNDIAGSCRKIMILLNKGKS